MAIKLALCAGSALKPAILFPTYTIILGHINTCAAASVERLSLTTRQTNTLLPSMSRVHNISHTHVPHTGSLVHIDPVQRAFPTPHTDSLAHIDPMTSFPDASLMYYVAQYEHERRYQYCHSKKVSMPSRNHLYDRCVRCSTKKI